LLIEEELKILLSVWVEEGKMKKILSTAAMFLLFGMVSTAWAAAPDLTSLPEPSLLLLLGAGFIAVAGLGRKLKR
jgi:hypothetical protein